jgi:hypothetical protein
MMLPLSWLLLTMHDTPIIGRADGHEEQSPTMMSQQLSSYEGPDRASRLLHVSAATLLCVLTAIVVGAILDIVHNGNSGYPNFWRQVRCPFGYLVVFLLLIHGAVLGAIRQLGARALALSFVLVLAWLVLEPLWPRI